MTLDFETRMLPIADVDEEKKDDMMMKSQHIFCFCSSSVPRQDER